jgi:hypothetical protein
MPSGYSYKKLIGACKTSSSGDVLSYKQVNDKIQFILSPGTYNGLQEIVGDVLNAGSHSTDSWAPSATQVRGTTSFVPPLANTIELQLTTRGNVVLQVAPNGSYDGYLGTLPAPLVTYGHAQNIIGSLILESDNLYMSCDNTAGSIYCLGYSIDI